MYSIKTASELSMWVRHAAHYGIQECFSITIMIWTIIRTDCDWNILQFCGVHNLSLTNYFLFAHRVSHIPHSKLCTMLPYIRFILVYSAHTALRPNDDWTSSVCYVCKIVDHTKKLSVKIRSKEKKKGIIIKFIIRRDSFRMTNETSVSHRLCTNPNAMALFDLFLFIAHATNISRIINRRRNMRNKKKQIGMHLLCMNHFVQSHFECDSVNDAKMSPKYCLSIVNEGTKIWSGQNQQLQSNTKYFINNLSIHQILEALCVWVKRLINFQMDELLIYELFICSHSFAASTIIFLGKTY